MVTFDASISATGCGGSESLSSLGPAAFAVWVVRSAASGWRLECVADGCDPEVVSTGRSPSPGTESGFPVVAADCGVLPSRGPAGLLVGSSLGSESLACSGDRATLGTR